VLVLLMPLHPKLDAVSVAPEVQPMAGLVHRMLGAMMPAAMLHAPGGGGTAHVLLAASQ